MENYQASSKTFQEKYDQSNDELRKFKLQYQKLVEKEEQFDMQIGMLKQTLHDEKINI